MASFVEDLDDLCNLQDRELVAIGQLGYDLVKKYGRQSWRNQASLLILMSEIEKEATERFAQIGFTVDVDCGPMIASQPPIISISGRLGSAFDPDEKRWEVRKAVARNETLLNQDKNPMGTTVTGEGNILND